MSASSAVLQDKDICALIVSRYRSKEWTTTRLSQEMGLTFQTIAAVLRAAISEEERKTLRGFYHSKAKQGPKNPMYGARTAAERVLRGGRPAVWNGSGYTFEHRIIAAKMLGLSELPPDMEVHHIDGNKLNNHPDNLAICTKRGHQWLHKERLGRLKAWEKETFGTSVLSEIRAILQGD